MQSERLRQRRRERKRLERERDKKVSRKAQMCAGDELDFPLTRRVVALFGRAMRSGREEVAPDGMPRASRGQKVQEASRDRGELF